jgi:hypothetical protein
MTAVRLRYKRHHLPGHQKAGQQQPDPALLLHVAGQVLRARPGAEKDVAPDRTVDGAADIDSLIKFSIAALLEGNNNDGIYTIKTMPDDKKVLSKINPPQDLLKDK